MSSHAVHVAPVSHVAPWRHKPEDGHWQLGPCGGKITCSNAFTHIMECAWKLKVSGSCGALKNNFFPNVLNGPR